ALFALVCPSAGEGGLLRALPYEHRQRSQTRRVHGKGPCRHGAVLERSAATMRKRFWNELNTNDFVGLDPETTIAVLPIAATEQHAPHLPVATDTAIAEGMIAETLKQLSDDLAVLFLPIQAIGKSNEHLRSPGTITLTAETAIRAWTEI